MARTGIGIFLREDQAFYDIEVSLRSSDDGPVTRTPKTSHGPDRKIVDNQLLVTILRAM